MHPLAAHKALRTLETFTTMPRAENQRHEVASAFNILYEVARLYREATEGNAND
ncbi:hypothetical protein [Streptomyces sp. NPDC056817]|uniref:hypothetical protein n=1 Tax=Streptomyces sp. NPDC056817 TaxID=3345950 RepID=UPI0036AF43B3